MKIATFLLLLLPSIAIGRVYTESGCVDYPVSFRFSFADSLSEYKIYTFDSQLLTLQKDTALTYNLPVGKYKMWIEMIYPHSSFTDTTYYIVNPKPVIQFDSIPQLYKSGTPFNLSKYSTPVGGEWTCKQYPEAIIDGYADPSKLPPGRNYLTYTYTGPTTHCTSSDSIPVDIIDDLTGIATSSHSSFFSVFPNPFKNKLTIGFRRPVTVYAIRIFDLRGKEFYSRQEMSRKLWCGEIILNGLTLPEGVYILQVSSSAGTETVKISTAD